MQENVEANKQCYITFDYICCACYISRESSTTRNVVYIAHARLCVSLSVCLSVCLSLAPCPYYCMDPEVTWGNGRGCPLVVQYWPDMQLLHGFRCYDPNANVNECRFWATVCKTVRPMLSDRCLSVLSVLTVCDVGVLLWPNGWMDQHETWHADRPRPWPHCVS